MAVTVMPINQVTVPARQNRQAFAALMMPGVGPLRTRSGFRPGGEPTVTVTAATWSVGPFSSIVDTGQSSVTGPYLVASDATETDNMTPADETYARKDILYLQLDDGPDEDASGQRRGRVLYQAGVASATPELPATPARSFLVRTIDVPKAGNGAPVAANNSPLTVASGGLLPVRNQAEEDAVAAVAYPGMSIWRIDIEQEKIRGNNGWKTVAATTAVVDYSNSFQLKATITNPTKGNSVYVATYTEFNGWVDYEFQVTIGSTFAVGSGTYLIPLPVPAASTMSAGSGWILDNTSAFRGAIVDPIDANNLRVERISGVELFPLDHTGPGTAWAQSDFFKGSLRYRRA